MPRCALDYPAVAVCYKICDRVVCGIDAKQRPSSRRCKGRHDGSAWDQDVEDCKVVGSAGVARLALRHSILAVRHKRDADDHAQRCRTPKPVVTPMALTSIAEKQSADAAMTALRIEADKASIWSQSFGRRSGHRLLHAAGNRTVWLNVSLPRSFRRYRFGQAAFATPLRAALSFSSCSLDSEVLITRGL